MKRQSVRFGDYVREQRVQNQVVSYNGLLHKTSEGKIVPFRHHKMQLHPIDIYKLFGPFLSSRLGAQIRAVIPLAIYLVFVQLVVLQQSIENALSITTGLIAVIIGLMCFLEGIRLGLMPFVEDIGDKLPQKASFRLLAIIVFFLGVGVAFADPAVTALKMAGLSIDPQRAPLVASLLNQHAFPLMLAIGFGVGVATLIGTLRFIYQWSLKTLIILVTLPALLLTAMFTITAPELASIVALAWDCGGITTGPVTVPFILALGIGVSASLGRKHQALGGLGLVTLASLVPVITVLGLGLYLHLFGSTAHEALPRLWPPGTAWFTQTPFAEIRMGLRAVVPLVGSLLLIHLWLIRERIAQSKIILTGLLLTLFGMILFNIGLTYGIHKLGMQSGSAVPGLFTQLDSLPRSPFYGATLGMVLVVLIPFFLGIGATVAEPALAAFGTTVENVTNGIFKQRTLMALVSIGVGLGMSVGVLKIIYNIPILYILMPGYLVALTLTLISSEEYTSVAWDSAAVTTGPVTVPLVIALGVSLGDALHVQEGFGILAATSICPIITVLLWGLIQRVRVHMQKQKREP